ncbi:hypothetical protein [Streptomyces sp. MJP52]|uniref:hypothetical protein n=1 Tax=Streptomyces sp. MJP52 TaxID=2940555 RepID=UPI002475B04D|nr:hypothetical protein [Streptomyces sp. MJP52]MDH6223419.1 hypothetical protein [Streptomyces sp. MJP52]
MRPTAPRLTVLRTTVTRSAAVLAVTLLGATACGSPDGAPAGEPAASGSPAAATPEVLSTLADRTADFEGGNAQRAMEQLGSDVDIRFTDASGAGRPVENPVEWRLCTVHQLSGTNGREVYQFGVVRTDEKC